MNNENTFHYYAADAMEWRVNNNLADLIEQMKGLKNKTFAIWKVYLPIEADYEIDNYRPDVDLEILSLIGQWKKDDNGDYKKIR